MGNELSLAHLVNKQEKYHQYHQLTFTEQDSKMDKSIVGLITIGILCYLVAMAGVAIIITVGIVGFIFLCVLACKKVAQYKNNRLKKQKFTEQLLSYCGYNIVEENDKNLDENLSKLLAEYISRFGVAQIATQSFEEVRDKIQQVFDNCSVGVYKSRINFDSFETFQSNALSRCAAGIKINHIFKLSNFINVLNFSIINKYWTLHALTQFCIFETTDSIEIVDWKNFKIKDLGAIYIAENSFALVKGATPAYHEYLHERVGGGPDRRYKNNPSTPVYRYGNLEIKINKSSIFLSIANEDFVSEIVDRFNNFLNILPMNLSSRHKTINEINLSEDEIASLFKELVLLHGRTIFREKRFLSILSDYRVLNNKSYLKPILKYIGDNGYWPSIMSQSCDIDILNNLKEEIVQKGQFEEDDVAYTLAYIGYGLQILNL